MILKIKVIRDDRTQEPHSQHNKEDELDKQMYFLYTQKKNYVKQGLDKYEKKIKNYSIDNYSEEIWDGDLQ